MDNQMFFLINQICPMKNAAVDLANLSWKFPAMKKKIGLLQYKDAIFPV